MIIAHPGALHLVEPVKRHVDSVVAAGDVSHHAPCVPWQEQPHRGRRCELMYCIAALILKIKGREHAGDEEVAVGVVEVPGERVGFGDWVEDAGGTTRSWRQTLESRASALQRAGVAAAL